MNWIAELQNINYIAVAIATIASYLLGFAWYHWAVFGEVWANALNITKEEADNTEGLGGAFIVSLVSGLTKALCVALLMAATNISGVLNGAFFGAVVAIVFIVTSLGYYNGFARTSSKLTLINSTHSIVEITLVGAIIGAFT
ncbi:putative integral membrane protein [gamma proteobacterium IMCC1989]|nr:putative integral membrane protein [gamma proteobacterium IMCC1989]